MRPIIDRLNRALNEALASKAMADRFKLIGENAAPGTPEDYAAVIKKTISQNGKRLSSGRHQGERIEGNSLGESLGELCKPAGDK